MTVRDAVRIDGWRRPTDAKHLLHPTIWSTLLCGRQTLALVDSSRFFTSIKRKGVRCSIPFKTYGT
jgi:hypothetical protein